MYLIKVIILFKSLYSHFKVAKVIFLIETKKVFLLKNNNLTL